MFMQPVAVDQITECPPDRRSSTLLLRPRYPGSGVVAVGYRTYYIHAAVSDLLSEVVTILWYGTPTVQSARHSIGLDRDDPREMGWGTRHEESKDQSNVHEEDKTNVWSYECEGQLFSSSRQLFHARYFTDAGSP